MRASIKISLIIPAYNEAAFLPRLLGTVAAARGRYKHGPDAIEVIVVDNESTDATPRIAEQAGCSVVVTPIHRIGAVRNAGARTARGTVLCFVDADMQIHPDTFNAIDDAISTGRILGGATGVTLERMSIGIAVTYAFLVPLVWLTGFDTGVVFCGRADFAQIGGYDEDLRFAEDVRFMYAMHKLARSREQRLSRLRRCKAVSSTRKFDEHGEWHYFGMMGRAALQMAGLANANEFADRYWYKPRR